MANATGRPKTRPRDVPTWRPARRTLVRVLVIVAALLVGTWASGRAATEPGPARPPGPPGTVSPIAEPIAIPDYAFLERTRAGDERERAIGEFRGRVVILNFWASWCGVCAKELPRLDRLAGRVADARIDVIALSIDDHVDEAAEALRGRGHHRLRVFQDHQSVLAPLLGVRGVPTTFVVDSTGRAVAVSQGPTEWDAPETEAWLRSLAAAPRDDERRPE